MKKLSSVFVLAALIVSVLQMAPTAQAGGGATYYLALGDSVAVGYQPARVQRIGYTERVWRDAVETIPALELRNRACVGETTLAMITGNRSECYMDELSQLDRAVAFLEGHVGEMAFITITIGANDVVARCINFRTGEIDRACVVEMRPRLQYRVGLIVDALSAAAPGVPIVGMTYYNPFLGLWAIFPYAAKPVTRANARAWSVFNGALTTAYEGAGATVADVAATFQVDNFTDTVVQPAFGEVPVNVAHACGWTWFCSFSNFGDPHPNKKGYEKIATTFIRELRGLL